VASFKTTGSYIHTRRSLDPLCHRNQLEAMSD